MYETKDSESNATKYATTVERKSERELVVTRTFNGPAHIVFDAWTNPNCSSGGGHRSRLECPSSPARPMLVRGASTVSCSVTLPPSSLWHFSVGMSK